MNAQLITLILYLRDVLWLLYSYEWMDATMSLGYLGQSHDSHLFGGGVFWDVWKKCIVFQREIQFW